MDKCFFKKVVIMSKTIGELNSPLYNIEESFWHNVINGQRPLNLNEKASIVNTRSKISDLQEAYCISLKTEFLGRRIRAPVAIFPGPAYGSKILQRAGELGWTILMQKTVRMRCYSGKHSDKVKYPNVVPCRGNFLEGFVVTDGFQGTATNAFAMGSWSAYGGENKDDVGWANDLRPFIRTLPDENMLIVSVAYNADAKTEEEMAEQYADAAVVAKSIGAHAVEANVSCPNTVGNGDGIYRNPALSKRIMERMRDKVGHDFPLGIKIGYLEDYNPLVEATANVTDYYAAINTIRGIVKYPDGSPAFPHTLESGIGGVAIFRHGIEAATKLVKVAKRFNKKVMGGGGITTPRDALQYYDDAKVDVVGVATAAIFRPFIAPEIEKELLKFEINKKR